MKRRPSRFQVLQRLSELLYAPATEVRPPFSRCLTFILKINEHIPVLDVPGPVREALGGYLFPEGPGIVGAVVHALRDRARLFGGYPAADELSSAQDRAQGWLTLREDLRALADRADVLYQAEQAAVTRRALGVLSAVEGHAAQAHASPDDHERKKAMSLPLALLHKWHRRRAGRG